MYRRLLVVLAALSLFALGASSALAASPIVRLTIPLDGEFSMQLGAEAPCLGGAGTATLRESGTLEVMLNTATGTGHGRATASGTFTAVGADGATYTGSFTSVTVGKGTSPAAEPQLLTVQLHAAGVNTATGEPVKFVAHYHVVRNAAGTAKVEFDKATCIQ